MSANRSMQFIVLCFPSSILGAAVITVGPGLDVQTIPEALVLAADGDEVAIASGTWISAAASEPVLQLQQRALTVRALDPSDPPVLDGGEFGRAAVIDGGVVVLQDVVLQGGAIPGGDLDGDGATAHWERSGGAITIHNATVTLQNVSLHGGTALHGGCLSAWDSDVLCTNVDITSGVATFFGGGMRVHGGALVWNGGNASNCTSDTGGAIAGGGGCVVSLSNVLIQSCVATYYGGAVCLDSSQSSVHTTFSDVTVMQCIASQSGGGVYAYGGALQATNLVVEQCQAANGAGVDAIAAVLDINIGSLRDNIATDEGGGLRVVDGSALLERVTVQRNQAVYGAGVLLDWCDEASVLDVSYSENNAQLRGGALYATGARDTYVTQCQVSGNTAGLGVDGMVFASSNAGLVSDTSFCGQAVHVGGVWADLGGNSFEQACSGASCVGDVDGSGQIGPGDLVDLIFLWGSGSGAADCDDDGLVGVLDLIALLKRWGIVC